MKPGSGAIFSSVLRLARDNASENFEKSGIGGRRTRAERECFVLGWQTLLASLLEEGAFVITDDETPFLPGTTVAEMVEAMATNHRSPGRDELQALIERVVANTCEHLQQARLGTLTVERYIVEEKHR